VNRADCLALDAGDPLAAHRGAFALPPGVVYLDGNSLGALPRATLPRLQQVVEHEWGTRLIRSWNEAGWVDAPQRIGAKLSELIGARAEEVVCADSTSLNVFKVLACALRLQARRPQVSETPRRVIVSERSNFPTDLYMAQGLAELLGGYELRLVEFDDVASALDDSVAALLLTQVNYRSGAVHDMAAITARAQAAGALTVWDLAHSAGAIPVELNAARADFAIGCGYKYLNGGPGAPAFLFVAQRHLDAAADDPFAQPLSGWFGHRTPFVFDTDYAPAATIERFTVGTPSIVALAALEVGIDTVRAAGVAALREKSIALSELFIALVDERCPDLGLELVSPRDAPRRGSQVSYAHANAWPVMQALVARGVIGDCRRGGGSAPDVLRFGFAPLYNRHVDVWDAVEALRDILVSKTWDRPAFRADKAVT